MVKWWVRKFLEICPSATCIHVYLLRLAVSLFHSRHPTFGHLAFMAKYLNIFRGAKVEPKDVSSGDIVILYVYRHPSHIFYVADVRNRRVIGPTGVGKSTVSSSHMI